MSEHREEQSVKYWTEFCIHLHQRGDLQFRFPSPIARKRHFIDFPMGMYTLRASQKVRPPVIGAAFILKGNDATTYFNALVEQQEEIHSECGRSLSWYAEAASEKRIAFLKWDIDVKDETDWSDQHEWIISKFEKLIEVFHSRIERLMSKTTYSV